MKVRMRGIVAALMGGVCALAAAGGAGAAGPATLSARQIDEVVESARKAFDVPGVAVAVIQPGQAPYLKGYGTRDGASSPPVDAGTLFGIGSISKAFTTTAIAMLAQEGKLDWNDPVIKHIPEFRMADPWVTREFTIRDLVTHRSGLGPYAGDLIILTDSKANRKQVYQALANLPAATSFRTTYAYDNLLYIVAGDLVERVSGQSWQDFVTARILKPLDMSGCVADQLRLGKDAPKAVAHDYADGKLEAVDFPLPQVTVPAGGIFCNAQGMAKWMAFNLGAPSAVKLDKARAEELFRPVTPTPTNPTAAQYAGASFSAYGLGWFLQDSYGRREAQHGGGLPGMVSQISIFPGSGFGVMVMSNKSTRASSAIAMRLANLAFSDHPQDFIPKMGAGELQAVAQAAKTVTDVKASPRAGFAARAALPPASYVGRYRDPWFGEVEVRVDNGALVMDLGSKSLTGPLNHVDGDLFVAAWRDRGLNADAYANFRQDEQGRIVAISMQAVSPRTDPSFNFHDLHLVREDAQR